MNEYDLKLISTATEKMLNDALYNPFKNTIDLEEYKDYKEIVGDPIYLYLIKKNIDNGIYKSYYDWYSDVEKMFNNAIKYWSHKKQNPDLLMLASYLLELFNEEHKYARHNNIEQWLKDLTIALSALQKELVKSPVVVGIDSMVPLLSSAKDSAPPKYNEISDVVQNLNEKIVKDNNIRNEVFSLLRLTEPELDIHEGSIINANELKPLSQNALMAYIKSK